MSFKVDIDSITLDILVGRLKGVVSAIDILKWLANFEEDEQRVALSLISNLTVYTSNEIEEKYHKGLNIIIRGVPSKSKIAIHPIGLFGKSGSMMAYLLRKTNTFNINNSRLTLIPDSKMLSTLGEEHETLVLLDDFTGTGSSIEKYYNSDIIAHIGRFKQIHFLGVAAMKEAIIYLKPYFTSIIIDNDSIYKKAFSSEASYFGYRKYTAPKELAYKYGEFLTKPERLKSGKPKYRHALGHENSQSLVAFFYGCPNNTLPIFWQGDSGRIKWTPLIPRFNAHKIQKAREFRKQLSYELSLFKEFGSEMLTEAFVTYRVKKGKKEFSSVNHIDFSVYGILKLQRDGFSEFNICQRLGISSSDYLDYLKRGKQQGIFDSTNKITQWGLELYQEAKRCINNNLKNRFEGKSLEIKNIHYFPKSFNGRT
ncbi:phosphoribosyltransferase-like protein [Chitinophaga niabensis]|uniref:Uncharacterized protein n=1 Tax=Chitinophaga niabensis TaxID=536979 RepID=A0A1N6FJA3_9BACT|nr:hypothetical protein [Chitinophaga niabensis]SIN95339.1 hypothetical protein SAMN04488055_2250 [Chitinophaga niabensis]